VVHGSSTAGGAYVPGLSDYTIMVRKNAKVFLAGPPLLKAATGEIAGEEELGGAQMHSQVSGTSEFLAESDADGIRLAREVMASLDWNKHRPHFDDGPAQAPLYSPDELCGVVPVDYRQPYDCREVIARIVDGSEFLDFKSEYDNQTICGRARIHGMPVGILGNNGPITAKGAAKAGQFIQLCDQADIPLVFLMNTTGYMVGTESEQSGIVKHGSKMIQAVTNATVPQLTIQCGASFGAGNYGMCGRGYAPRFLFTWPNAKTAVMGGEQAARTMQIVTEAAMARKGLTPDAAQSQAQFDKIVEVFEQQAQVFYTSGLLLDDGVIDPRDTREVLAQCLAICTDAHARTVRPMQFGVARM